MQDNKFVILVSEDDPAIRSLVSAVLTRFGHIVIEASEGYVAFQLYRMNANIIDLVLTDVNCDLGGGVDGPKLIRAIIALNNALGRNPVPVVFMTGDPGRYAYADLKDLSKNEVLLKAFTTKELIGAVHAVLLGQFTKALVAVAS